MKFLKDNKGIIIFYICVIAFVMVFSAKVERDNDRMLQAKYPYLNSQNI